MKIDEPNTPYIKYDPATDTVTNWEGSLTINSYTTVTYYSVIQISYTQQCSGSPR